MLSLNNKISLRQLQILLVLDIFGCGVTILPRVVVENAGHDGWISIIIATLIVAVFAYILSIANKNFPNDSFFEVLTKLLSRPIAVLICFAFVIKIVINCALELRIFGEIMRRTMLVETPFAIICAAMLLLAGYAAAKGYETRARIAEILIYVIFIPLLIIFGIATRDVDFTNLLPVLQSSNPSKIGSATLSAIFAFKGIEVLLLVNPYLQRPKKMAKAVVPVVLIMGALMTIITIITIARFGELDLKHLKWPVIEMMDSIGLPGSFMERQDALMMSFWIVSIFAVVNASLFFSSILLKDVIETGKHIHYILIVSPIIFFISHLPTNIEMVYEWERNMNMSFGIIFMVILPIIMILLSNLRVRMGSANADEIEI